MYTYIYPSPPPSTITPIHRDNDAKKPLFRSFLLEGALRRDPKGNKYTVQVNKYIKCICTDVCMSILCIHLF